MFFSVGWMVLEKIFFYILLHVGHKSVEALCPLLRVQFSVIVQGLHDIILSVKPGKDKTFNRLHQLTCLREPFSAELSSHRRAAAQKYKPVK